MRSWARDSAACTLFSDSSLPGGTVAKNNTARRESPAEKPAGARVRAVAGNNTLPDLDRLIHERMRLGIVSALAANQSLTFNELKKLLKTTDGNLSVHARKLRSEERR